MQMSDVIKVVGESSLKEFPWGNMVKDTINLFAKNEFRLNENSTGNDVLRSLDSLGHEVKDLVLKATIDPSRCSVTQPVGGGMVVKHTDECHDDPTVQLWRAMLSPKFVVVTTIVCVIVVVALNMVFRLSAHDDLSWQALIDAIIEVSSEEKE